MPYKSLYTRRQLEADVLPRSWYIADASGLQWVKSIKIKVEPALLKERARGLIIRETAEVVGGLPRYDYTIIIAGYLSPEMQRFVTIKELMHCYFGPTPENLQYATDTAITLQNHFREFFGDSATMDGSAHVQAERLALWMAIGVICPDHKRVAYAAALQSGQTTPDQIAAELRIPLHTTKALFSKHFEDEIAHILN